MLATPCSPDAVASLVAESMSVDRHPPLSEHKSRAIGGAVAARIGCWGAEGAVDIVSVAASHRRADGATHWALEVAVRPNARTAAIERESLERALSLLPGRETVTLWTHRDAQRLAAEALGFTTFRELLMMAKDLPAADPEAPEEYAVRRFVPGRDEETIVAINNAAFSGHRENDNMTPDDLSAIEEMPWFEAAGLLVATRDDRAAGFCWTKVHSDGSGEIYIIAVSPEHRGRGLGRWLVLEGLAQLHQRRGVSRAVLWTDADNLQAMRLYESLGFVRALVNREMRRDQPNG